MTTITILPEKADSYRALAGEKEATGRTAGEALDALTARLEAGEGGTLVIVQSHRPDEFFDAAQQERLAELMQLHEAGSLSTEEERELESLVEAELVGARERAKALTVAAARGGQIPSTSSGEGSDAEESTKQVLLDPASPLDILENKLRLEELLGLTTLAPADKRIMAMLVLENLTYEEAAERLNVSRLTVRLSVRRLAAKLRYRLRQSMHNPASPADSTAFEKKD